MRQRWQLLHPAEVVEVEQVLDQGARFDLPIHAARGLDGNRFYVRQANGRPLFVEEGDWVVRFADGLLDRLSPLLYQRWIQAQGTLLP
jgi:hypothetical protein